MEKPRFEDVSNMDLFLMVQSVKAAALPEDTEWLAEAESELRKRMLKKVFNNVPT
jgi:hypothetical protein